MDQVAAMAVLDGLEQLPDHVFFVNCLEDIGSDHRVEVSLHVVEDDVDILVIVGPDIIELSNDVVMAELA